MSMISPNGVNAVKSTVWSTDCAKPPAYYIIDAYEKVRTDVDCVEILDLLHYGRLTTETSSIGNTG